MDDRRLNIELLERNPETAALVITHEDTKAPQDITAATVEVIVKPTKDTPDDDPSVVTLSTQTTGVAITNGAGGMCTVTFPDDLTPTTHWWRVDVILSGNRKTAAYGSLYVINT